MKNKIVLMLFVVVGFSSVLRAQDEDAYLKKIVVNNGDTLKYRILLPKDFSESKQYPVVLFLHGAGERGNDNKSQLIHGKSLFANEAVRDSFPAIVVFPQCPKEDYWANVKRDYSKKGLEKFKYKRMGKPTKSMKLVIDFMDDFINNPYVKKDQVYVGGLSMGGMGTFEILKRRPNMFAAAFPICGGGHPKATKKYADKVALWVFHGGEDNVVIPYFALRMVTALQKRGADVRLTYFEHDNHNSWDSTFAEPELLPWLFSKSKKQR